MKITETLIRKLIRESLKRDLLTEARFALKNLLIFKETIIDEVGTNLFDAVNESFIKNGGTQHDLNNPKSAGRFFIDVLFECMEELNEVLTDRPRSIDIPDWLDTVTNYILFLFNQKEVTSRFVLSGENFKEYILNFMNNYSKISFPGTVTIYEKLQYVYQRLNEKAIVANVEIILNNKEMIKAKETLYPFGNQAVNGYLVVAPKTTRSSIFWARTNWLGEEIVLPGQDDISWCTARYKGGNMFNSYCMGGGMTLFYFLPVNDLFGTGKFCVGIQKKQGILPKFKREFDEYVVANKKELPVSFSSDSDFEYDDNDKDSNQRVYEHEHSQKFPEKWGYDLIVGGHTTVGFENKPIVELSSDFRDAKVRQKINKALKITDKNILLKLLKEMETKDFADPEKYVAMLDVEQFASVTNLDNLAPIDPKTGKRDREAVIEVQDQINHVFSIYDSKLYKAKGYVPDEKILNYVDKNYLNYIKEGITLPLMIPKNFQTSVETFLNFINILINLALEGLSEVNSVVDAYWKSFKVNSNNQCEKLFECLKRLGVLNSREVIDKVIFLFYITRNNELRIAKKFFDFSSIKGVLNYIEDFENHLLKYKNSNFDFKIISKKYYTGKLFMRSNNFSEEAGITDLLLFNNAELLSMNPNVLINLFTKYKLPMFFQSIDKKYILDNPKIALDAAIFVKESKLYEPFEYLEYACIFVKNPYSDDENSTNLPIELLMNKKFITDLIQISHSNEILLRKYNLPFKNEDSFLTLSITGRPYNDLIDSLVPVFKDKIMNNEMIDKSFLNNLSNINPLSVIIIMQCFRFFNNYDENYKNMLTFIIEFLENESNVIKLLSAQPMSVAYRELINANGCIAYGLTYSNMMFQFQARLLPSVSEIKQKNEDDYDPILFDRIREIYNNIRSFDFTKKIVMLIKNQILENFENFENFQSKLRNDKNLKKFFEHDLILLINALANEFKKPTIDLLGNLITFQVRDEIWFENKKINRLGKIILTENQLRDLIAKSLRS